MGNMSAALLIAAMLAAVPATTGLSDGRVVIVQPDSGAADLPALLKADAADGRLKRLSLIEAALTAEGIHDSRQIARYRLALKRWRDRLQRSERSKGSPADRARAIHRFLHGQMLNGGYQADRCELSRALDRGQFNCVSATILYYHLGTELGLPLAIVERPGHVFCRLKTNPPVDVETTCADWLDAPKNSPKRPADRLATSREITPLELVAKIYYNAGVAGLQQRRFRQAVAATQNALRLDPDDPASRDNLLAAMNNWALALCREGQFNRAAELVIRGRRIDPDYPPLAANDLHIHQQWVLRLCESGRYEAAIALLEQGYRRRPDAELFDAGRFAVYRLWAASLLTNGRTDPALDVFAAARRRYGRHVEVLKQEAYTINDRAVELIAAGDFRQAVLLLDRGLARQPACELLLQNRRVAEQLSQRKEYTNPKRERGK